MSLFHRYILKNVLISTIAAVAMFAFLFLAVSTVKDVLGLLAEGQLTIGGFFELLQLLAPHVFVFALPMGFMVGVLITMGRLSAEHEITSLRAAGISVVRLASSVFFLALLGTAGSLVINFYYGPIAKTEYRQQLKDTIETNPLGFILEKTFVKEFENTVIYVGKKDAEMLYDLWIWRLDDQSRVTEFVRAERGRFNFIEDSSKLQLFAENAESVKQSEDDPEDFRSRDFFAPSTRTVPLSFDLQDVIGRESLERKLTWMTFDELRREMTRYEGIVTNSEGKVREEAAKNLQKAKMVFHGNFATGFAVLSFACIAVPLGLKTSRKETSANLGLGFALGILYYFSMTAIGWMDGMAQFRPELLYWLPNFACQGYGIWLFWRLDHGKKPRAIG